MTRSVPLRRCAQCWQWIAASSFIGARGKPVRLCAKCRARYRGWDKRSLAQKLAELPAREDPALTGRIIWSERSGNTKTGPIPVSMSERGTCPPSCGLYEAGCYAEYGMLGAHWRATGDRGLSWAEFLERVRALPEGQLWRHNEAGDLAGTGPALDLWKLGKLVAANRGRRGFTFTHKHGAENLPALRGANDLGFTINLSADSLEQADALFDGGLLRKPSIPVAVLLPHDAPKSLRTPQGHRVIVCPAQTSGTTCSDCELCANASRHSIVGFRAHGQFKAHVPELVKLGRRPTRLQPAELGRTA